METRAADTAARPTLTAPRRPAKTYTLNGREVYADTGRPVEENLGSHIVLWIVEDADAWAAKIEADADAAVARYPKDRIAAQHRARDYETAADVRARGAYRSWRGPHYGVESAQAEVAELYRAHPNPGVRYEVAAIVEASACDNCHQPTIYADGEWRHCSGRYPAECRRKPEPVEEEPRQDGEFQICTSNGAGFMTCGYCDLTERWAQTVLGYATLTGDYLLGVEMETRDLVVLAEGKTLAGEIVMLPHHCEKIPNDVREKYADDIAALIAQSEGG